MSNLGRRHGKFYLCLVIWAAVAFPAVATTGLDPRKAITQLHHDVWRTEQGLPQLTITAMVQTRDGYLWLGTESGLARFDGLRFTVFDKRNTPELKSNLILSMLEDREGRLWIGTSGGGLTFFSGGKFTSYTTKDGLSNDVVLSLYEDRSGTVWAGTRGGGLNAFRNGHSRAYTTRDGLSDDDVYALTGDSNGDLWIGTRRGLTRMAGNRFQVFRPKDGLPHEDIRCLIVDHSGNLWMGSNGGGLGRFKDGKFSVLTTRNGLAGNAVMALTEDSAGSLWIGTIGGGLGRLANGKLTSYSSKEGLISDDIWSLRQDRDGHLWIATTGGLERLSAGAFTTYSKQEGLSYDVTLPVLEDHRGDLWVGTQRGGLNRFRDGQFTAFTTRQGLAGDFVMSLAEDPEGNLWVGTRDGLSRFHDGKFTSYTTKDGLSGNFVVTIYVDRRGTVWAGTSAGLSRFENGRFITYTAKDGMSSQSVHTIMEDRRGNLWIGTAGGGLNRLVNGKFTAFTSRQGLSNDVIMCMYEDAQGVFWIGSGGGGLSRFKDGRFITITMKDGLLDDTILGIMEDGLGRLWMSTNRGVMRASLQELNDFTDGKTRSVAPVLFGASDGMKSAECNGGFQPSIWKARDGRIWFPTMQGLAVVNPNDREPVLAVPPVMIEQVFIDRHSFDSQQVVEVPPGNGELEFRYAALGFEAPERISFRYQLSGFDREWIEAGARRTAYYTNIPPGTYHFQVIARNGAGAWSTTGASFGFTLRPHFYQARWFYGLCGLSVLGLLAGVHLVNARRLRIRERILRKMEELNRGMRKEISERERAERDLIIAKETAERASRIKSEFLANMSHEIRTPLNGVLGMTELVLGTELTEEQCEHLGEVRNSANALLRILSDILDFSKIETGKLYLNPVDFDLPAMVENTIESLAGKVREKGLRLACKIDPDVPVIARGDQVRLRQILFHLLSNSIKFTEHGQVALEVHCTGQDEHGSKIHFVVRDTGIGIPHDKQGMIFRAFSQVDSSTTRKFGGTGLGLAICLDLVHLMDGEIWVQSTPGVGSEFHFRISLAPPLNATQQSLEALAMHLTQSAAGHEKPNLNGAVPDHATPGGLRILVVEDNIVNQRLMLRLLERRGHAVSVAANGLEALAALDGGRFDVVLMDLQMPEMDGLEATTAIRKREKLTGLHQPIIAVTANTMNGEREVCLAVGMDGYIAKPVQPDTLFRTVESAVFTPT